MHFVNRKIWLSILLSVVAPMALGYLLAAFYPGFHWENYPFHSMLETAGAVSALTIAALMIMMIRNNHLPQRYTWVAFALIAMGLLDGFHAVLLAGQDFVWLHSIATTAGGVIFAAIWLPALWATRRRQNILVTSLVVASVVFSVLSIAWIDHLPVMVAESGFTLTAKILNFTGGIGFLVGALYFFYDNLFSGQSDRVKNEDIVFANHCLLFGIAGLLFESSVIWDAGWWWWHILRLAAYLVVLVYFMMLFKQQQDTLSANEKQLVNINNMLERRVQERTIELEKASRAKTDFLSSMSHELRTPMNAILGFGQILERDSELNGDQKRMVTEIIDAGSHLMRLINEVLDLATIEKGKMVLNVKDTNLNTQIGEAISLLSPEAIRRSISIINSTMHGKDTIVLADPLRLKQVIINLLSNAIKYNEKGGTVEIMLKSLDENMIRVSIKDTGPGIDPNKQDKLFRVFERLGYEGCDVEGAGIGLALSKKMVELMNGRIGIESSSATGSIFYFDIPLGRANQDL